MNVDIIEKENVKVPSSVIITGMSNTPVDEEIFDYLKQYGAIERKIEIPLMPEKVIVEFKSGTAVESLKLPIHRTSEADPEIVHHIDALASVYSIDKGSVLTGKFLSDLQNMAKISGKSFEQILQDELARITDAVSEQNNEVSGESEEADSSLILSPSVAVNATPVKIASEPTPKLPSEQIIPPEVQRLVVEHIVKTTDSSAQSQSTARLRSFSGRIPCPNFEVDYETWRDSVEFYIADPTISERQLVRKIVDSLSSPAASVVKPLGPHSSPRAYLELLDSAYATVEDGDELFAKFLNLNQNSNSGEKASSYLQRLQTVLNKAVQMKAIPASDADTQLLKQFCRGCWENDLINKLQLEHKTKNPPTFSEFLMLLRTEEDKQAAKDTRMKRHLGFTKTKAQSQAHNVSFPDNDEGESHSPAAVSKPSPELKQIQKQLVALQAQIATLMQHKEGKSDQSKGAKKKNKPSGEKEEPHSVKQPPVKTVSAAKRPKPWYCFQCGEDGHIKTTCSNPPDPALVNAKRQELKAKQVAWEKNNTADPLND